MKSLADIYFYNAMGLASDLKKGNVSEVRALKHLIVSLILSGIGFEVPLSVEFEKTTSGIGQLISGLFSFIIAGIICYYGVWLTYQVNNKGDGKEYFLRFAALTLPVGIQLVISFLIVAVLLVLLSMALTSQLGIWGVYFTMASFYLAGIAFMALFFMRMRKYIAVASGAPS